MLRLVVARDSAWSPFTITMLPYAVNGTWGGVREDMIAMEQYELAMPTTWEGLATKMCCIL